MKVVNFIQDIVMIYFKKNYIFMNNIDKQYLKLLNDILENRYKKQTRNGGVLSVFGRQIRHDMKEGFPLLTTKKMYFKGIIVELLWFLKGDTNIKYLIDNDCHIWDGDCYKNYLNSSSDTLTKEDFINKIKTNNKFAKTWGELGPIYGHQWRKWNNNVYNIDQIQNLINELKINPDNRRLMVSAWNVGEIDNMILPPCHYGFQVYTRELKYDEILKLTKLGKINENNTPNRAISLMWNQRSVDAPLGLPFNIASYALLLEILAKMVNMIPDELIGNLGDTHIYENQIEGIKEQLKRKPYELPTLKITDKVIFNGNIDNMLNSCNKDDFIIENYKHHPLIKMPLSN